MDGRNNLANQEVFRMAKAADPNGSRTVGVVTKCDALQPGEELGVSIHNFSPRLSCRSINTVAII